MKIFPLVKAEFARLTSTRMGTISLIALMTVPIVYGGLYLYGNEDPYDKLDRVPAALVIDDTGATVDDEAVNYGKDAADELLDDESFGWTVTTASEAQAGVVDGTYDFAVTFPSSFSGDIASATDDAPRQAQLVLTTNDTNSYLSTTIAKQASATIRTAIAESVGDAASRQLLDGISDIRDGFVDASDGAATLADGATDAATGASDAADGAETAADGAQSLSTGTTALATGAKSLSSGLAKLDDKAASLPSSAKKLSSGASKVADGAASAASSVEDLAAVTKQAADLTPTVRTQVAAVFDAYGVDAQTEAGILAELDGLTKATAGIDNGVSDRLSPGLDTLSDGAAEVAAGAKSLSTAAPTLADAIDSAATGAKKLSDGAADASAGASKLSTGVSTLSDGLGDLSTGVDKLSTGATKLSDSLADGLDDIPATTAAGRAATATAISNPVEVDQQAITEASNYGAGLAPFFISLAAWIGMYALFLLVRPLSRRALTAVRRPIRTTLAGWATPAALGGLQMVALFLVVTLGLHLAVANGLGLLAFMVFVSITFAAIVLALNALLGSVGQFLGLLLMVVQLVTAGGTFPWQTLPGPLAFLHQVLPMSHAVDGVRQLMYGGTNEALVAAIVPLVFWLLGSLAVAALAARKQGRFRTLRELRPSPIGG